MLLLAGCVSAEASVLSMAAHPGSKAKGPKYTRQGAAAPAGAWDPSAYGTPIAYYNVRSDEGAAAYTDTSCTVAAGDTDAIACIKDQSGQDNHIKQSTVSLRPVIDSTGIGGEFSADCDGTDDWIEIFPFTGGQISQPYHIYFLGAEEDGTVANRIYSSGHVPETDLYLAGTNWAIYAGGVAQGGTHDTSLHVFEAVFDGPTCDLYVDGTKVINGLNCGTGGLEGFTACALFNGANDGTVSWQAAVIYNGELTGSNRTDVGDKFCNWGGLSCSY